MKTNPKQETLGKLRDLCRLRHLALSTEQTYCGWVGSYIDWLMAHGRDLPDSRARVEAFLTRLAHRGAAASTQNQAFNALLFLYEQVRGEKLGDVRALRAKRPRTTRTALSREDTLALLDLVRDEAGYPTRLVVRMLYGCGLRVSEPLNLRVKDVDVAHSRVVWERDQLDRMPVEVPGLLARKYKNAPHAWQWAWVFPAHRPCRHPRTGVRVRYRMHEVNVQRCVKQAARQLGLESLVTPHVLRHCWATHVLDAGANVRDVQESLGHASLETTMGYVHPQTGRLPAVL